jgi:hypothetical protein
LERKALLLAASLKRHLPSEHELIAAVPVPAEIWQTPDRRTIDLLEHLGCRTVPIVNEIDCSYEIGNKVSCLRVATRAERLIFVDTDMLLVGDLGRERGPELACGEFAESVEPVEGRSPEPVEGRLFELPFSAKPADVCRVFGNGHWRRAYGAVGLKPPVGRVATTIYGQLAPPYFNAGFISVDPRSGFGDVWLDCCRRIDRKWGIRLKRPHLDQIALPVAVEKLGLRYECLGQRYNFPVHLKPIDAANPPLFAHYHSARVLRREPLLVEQVLSLCDEVPGLADSLKDDAEFSPLFDSRPRRISFAHSTMPGARSWRPRGGTPGAAELIITGIPRSGTSYLCNLLHRFDNCVILNEPDQIRKPLRNEPVPHGVGTFYRDVRRDVLEGKPIRNKLYQGKVTDETLFCNELTEYTPTVSRADFVLGVKNPLGFLFRLPDLQRAMPHARVVACVRNPFDTIASWKTSFSHLRTAELSRFQAGGLREAFISPHCWSSLRDVGQIKSQAWRRAAWWRLMAEIILDAAPRIMLIRYQRLMFEPAEAVREALEGFQPGKLREPIEPSEARIGKRSVLDEDDLQAIHALCGEHAAALGVADLDKAPKRSARAEVSINPAQKTNQPCEPVGFTR